MIKFINGNMFETPADVRINTVNCVGVMGAGVALAFKKQYPDMFKDYKKECKQGNIRPGKPHVWTDYRFEGNTIIINFPTKDHWRPPSKYEYIEVGLDWLKTFLQNKGKVSVTLPALGCGNGGLDWDKVKESITNHLEDLDAEIFVFEPADKGYGGPKMYRGDNKWPFPDPRVLGVREHHERVKTFFDLAQKSKDPIKRYRLLGACRRT